MAVADKVKSIIVEQLGGDEEEVTPDASFVDDLGADSLDTVELVMAFGEEVGCEIPADAAQKIVTVNDVVSFIESHRCAWVCWYSEGVRWVAGRLRHGVPPPG